MLIVINRFTDLCKSHLSDKIPVSSGFSFYRKEDYYIHLSCEKKKSSNTAEERVLPLGLHSVMRSGCSFSSAYQECKKTFSWQRFTMR